MKRLAGHGADGRAANKADAKKGVGGRAGLVVDGVVANSMSDVLTGAAGAAVAAASTLLMSVVRA